MALRLLSRKNLAAFAIFLGFWATPARAQTWNGTTSNDWNTASNWAGGVPIATGTAIFSATTPNNTLTLGGVTRSVRNVTFSGTTAAFTLGTGTLQITNDGVNPGLITINNTVTAVQTISAGLNFGGLGTFTPSLRIANNSAVNFAVTGALTNSDPGGTGANIEFTGTGTKSLAAIQHTGEFRLTNNGTGLVTVGGIITTALANGPINFDGTGNITISSTGRINTAVGVDIIKQGNGTLTLAASGNTAGTATVSVQQGIFNLNGNSTDPGALTGTGAGGTGIFTTQKNYNVNPGATLQLTGNFVTGNGYNNILTISGTLTVGNSQNYLNNASFAKGSTFNATGGTFIRIAGFTQAPNWNFETGGGTAIISTPIEIATGTGSGATANWTLNAVDADDVLFTTPVANFTGQLRNTTFGGTDGGIIKIGVGTIQFSNATNNYSGATDINDGALRAGAAGAFSPNSAFTLLDVAGAQLLLNNFSQTVASLAGGGATGGNVQLGAGTLTVSGTVSTTYSGIISGTGGLTKAGASTLTIGNGANTYTGQTNINGGTLSVGTLANGGVNSSIGASTNIAANLQFNGGTLLYSGGSIATDRAFTLNASGGTINISNAATTLTMSGAGGGLGGLIKTGGGVLLLTGANSYSGTTTINVGILRIGTSADRLPTGTSVTLANTAGVALDLNGLNQTVAALSGGGVTGGNVTMGAGTLTVNGSTSTTFSGLITGSGGLTKTGISTLTLGNAASSYTGNTNINGGVLSVGTLANGGVNSSIGAASVAATALQLNGGTLQYTGATVATNRAFTLNASSGTIDVSTSATVLTMSGNNVGAGGLVKTGAGVLLLSGANAYLGNTTINGGILRIGTSADRLPVTTTLILANTAGVAFDLNSQNQTVAGLTGGGVTGGNVTLGSGTITVNNTSINTYAGAISGTGGLTKTGNSTLTLSNATSSYTGPTTINAGILSVSTLADGGVNSSIGASAFAGANLVINGGTLQYTGPTVSSNRAFTVGASGATFDVSTTATNLTISGGISTGAGVLNKVGTGTLSLGGTITPGGVTNVNVGRLNVNGNLTTPTVNIASGATLGGSGTVNGNIVVNNGAILSPGNGIGTLNVGSGTTTTWANNGQFNVEYNTISGFNPGVTHDFLSSTGALSVTAVAGTPFKINLIYTGTPPVTVPTTQQIVIATFTGTAPAFSPTSFTVTGDIFAGSTFSVDAVGNNVVLTFVPVPEPTTILGLSAFAFGAIRTIRRRYTKKA